MNVTINGEQSGHIDGGALVQKIKSFHFKDRYERRHTWVNPR